MQSPLSDRSSSSPAPQSSSSTPTRRGLLGGAAALAGAGVARPALGLPAVIRSREAGPRMVGSGNALPGMQLAWQGLVDGADPLDAALEVVAVTEADESDRSVGLGGLPNERGVVQLDAAVMHGPTHNSGAVASIENILHPSAVAKLVMERTDHCLIVGPGAYDFARMHGHPHTQLLTERSRQIWRRWMETKSERDDYFSDAELRDDEEQGWLELRDELLAAGLNVDEYGRSPRIWGTIHCSARNAAGEVGCTTTTSGLSNKIPGRVGDSPIIGAGLYCDQEAGSAGATGRGEAAILANGSFAIVELMRQGAHPLDAGLEVLRRIARQLERQATWQPGLLNEEGVPTFGLQFYILGLDGDHAGVTLRGGGSYAVADPENGPHREPLVALFE